MGHTRLGTLPDTRPWRKVVGHIADGESAAAVAGATTSAAVRGLELAQTDAGLGHIVYLLAHTVLASRQPDFAGALSAHHIEVPPSPGLFDLTAGFSEAVRHWHSTTNTPRSDLAEMAAMAAVEALVHRVGERSTALFPTGGEVQRAVREFSTRNGFASLGHEFYSRLTQRFLLYHLGRELSHHVGGNGLFRDHAEHASFVADLDTHSREAALVVRDYAGDWHSKARFEQGITERQARRFANHSLKKIQKELMSRGTRRV
jgi:hypothetical protein